jgi:hypothetical protein
MLTYKTIMVVLSEGLYAFLLQNSPVMASSPSQTGAHAPTWGIYDTSAIRRTHQSCYAMRAFPVRLMLIQKPI